MSSPGLPTLTIDVASRRAERRIVFAVLLLMPIAISQWTLPHALFASVAALVAAAIVGGFVALGWIGGRGRLARIVCRPDGRWLLCEANGREIEAELTAASRMSTRALWLCWNARRHRPLLLLRGDISDAEFRRLLVRLRIAPFPAKDDHEHVV